MTRLLPLWRHPLARAAVFLALTAGLFAPLAARPQGPRAFELQPGDHICLIGNTLADRMQHDGWLETELYSRFPRHDLVIRNLGFSGDELTLRLRSANFGSPDDWLTACKADVIFAFFGYNESQAGAAGLDKFKKDLTAFIQNTLARKYNGKSAPRLVLFSSVPFEDHKSPNLPDGKETNRRIEMYTAMQAEVARSLGVPFVNLYQAMQSRYAARGETAPSGPLTINGIHLTEQGNRVLAAAIGELLFGSAPKRDLQQIEKIRQAVLDKNLHWYNRYRTVDGYSIYGGRADLRFVNGQTNREVMQREMQVLDVMTANRDQRIWALAQGRDQAVDDANTPPFIPVITNKPGTGPGGAHVFLDGEEAIKTMTLGKGLKINLFASEKEFPELINPVQMAFDTKGRLWVAVWPTYPHWKPKEPMCDKLLILEDTNGDGKADRVKTFVSDLHCPTGFEFWGGGVIVAQAPDLVFLKDTDGDDRADLRIRILSGLDTADTHHTANSFTFDPSGALYFQEGTFHHTQVETPYGPPERCANGGVFRYEPRTHKFEVYVSHGFANPHGHAFDRWGQDIVVDGTGAQPYHGTLFSGRIEFPQKHARPPQVYQQRTRPCPGIEVLSSRHFPEEFQGNLLVPNVIGFQGILRYRIDDKDSTFSGVELEPIVSSTDPNFRPADVEVGPDGAIYFCDWQNPIIGHMQHNLRDPSRDRIHGRVYRVTYEGRPLAASKPIAGQPVEKLVELLKEPDDRVRYRARIELSSRPTDAVLAAANRWLAVLDPEDPNFEHDRLEGLWLYQQHNVVNLDLLQKVLASPEPRARAAAVRVLCAWRDGVPDALGLLRRLAADPHPRVRLEAVRAASFFPQPEAVEVVLVSTEHPSDPALDFLRSETMKTLEPHWKKALASGQSIQLKSDVGIRYLLKNMSTDELLKLNRTRPVLQELLSRKGVRDEERRAAAAGLARLEAKSEPAILLDAMRALDEQPAEREESVLFDLTRLLTDRGSAALASLRPELEKLALQGKQPVTRQLGFVALAASDGAIDKVWGLAARSAQGLRDLVGAMPLLRDPGMRASLYPRVASLLESLPKELEGLTSAKGVYGRYVRIELPGNRKTLTLAEVEVMSNGRNLARQGRAMQKNTAHGGDAAKAIDGNTSGDYGRGGLTHTEENTSNPWWEVDLGQEHPIESIVIWNRTDDKLGNRLNNFTVRILDGARKEVFRKDRNPAPARNVQLQVGGSASERMIRAAAMNALTSVRGKEDQTFKTLARLARAESDRPAAIAALLRVPAAHWPAEEAQGLLKIIMPYVRQLPAEERTSAAALDAMQLAQGLAGLLPPDDGRAIRKELTELGVRVLRLSTVPDQMVYDQERLVVQAGKAAEIILENTDLMPHNLVLVRPGALEEIGMLAEATATQPGALERHYVPSSPQIILSSRLLQPRELERISFTAPKEPGVYAYVCTYPGHWRRMFGALYVVEDLDAFLTDAEGYLARRPLPIRDELLKYNRPRKEWTLDELSGTMAQLAGRSFNRGKQMFQVASCVACHRLNGEGAEIGPDLAKLDPKYQALEILKEILDPSALINEKYQTYTFETQSGKLITGLVLEETGDAIRVIENPLAKAEPLILKKSEIAERKKAAVSIMPKGLLDRLTREEILDLIAYVTARGDAKHKVFQGEHHH